MRAENIIVPLLLADNTHDGIHGRTKLQKFVFLLQKQLGDSCPSSYNFIPYDYGPFSKELAEDMTELQDEGFVEKREIVMGNKVEHRYKITDDGHRELEHLKSEFNIGDTAQVSEELVGKWNKNSLRRLISYVYSKYPRYAEKSVL